MWWDWGPISALDVILLYILITSILALMGYGFIRLFSALCKSKTQGFFSSFDYLQKLNFYLMLGFAFLFVSILIFSFFNLPFFLCIIVVIAVASLGFVLNHNTLRIQRFGAKEFIKKYSFTLVVLILLLVLVALSSSLVTGSYGSSNTDGADHTFFTRLILANPNVLWTHSAQPYVDTQIQYPLGTHVLTAFFVLTLNIPIQKVIIILTVILPALIALSFYSTIKCLFNHRLVSFLGLLIAGFFSIGFVFGPIWWSGLPLLFSLYLSISGMGLIFVFMFKAEWNWFNAFLIGLVLLIACETYPVSLLVLSFWLLLLLGFKMVLQFKNKVSFSLISRRNILVLLAFLVPILLAIPYLYFVFTFKIESGRYLTSDITSSGALSTFRDRLFFNWLNIGEQSVFFSGFANLLMLAPFSVFIIVALLIPKVSKKAPKVFGADDFIPSLALVYAVMLMVVGYLALTLLPIKSLLTFMDPERIWQHIYIFAVILTSAVVFSIVYFSYHGLKYLFKNDEGRKLKLSKRKIIGYIAFAILIFNVAVVCFPLVKEQQDSYNEIKSSFNRNTINQSDLYLMNWIMGNTPSDCRILISQDDSGQFVAAVTQRYTIAMDLYTSNYRSLMKTLTLNASDPQAIPLLIEFNVTYVYIGSTAMTYDIPQYIYRQFNATQMLSTPYFTIVKQYGNASLFSFNETLASTKYSEFEEET
jgi:hypothetical protein